MSKVRQVLVVNPERGSRQKFLPFLVLVEALLKDGFEVHFVSYYPVDMGERENKQLHHHVPNNGGGYAKSRFFHRQRSFLYLFFSVLFLTLTRRFSAIAVFRSGDSMLYKLAAFFGGSNLVLFVEYLPWWQNTTFSFTKLILQPRTLVRALGFYSASKIVVAAETVSKELIRVMPLLSDRVITIPYSLGLFSEDNNGKYLREDLAKRLEISEDNLILVAQDDFNFRDDFELLARGLSSFDDPSMLLIIYGDGPERSALLSIIVSLGLSNQVIFWGVDGDFIDLVQICDAVICWKLGAGTVASVVGAFEHSKKVIAPDTPVFHELLGSRDVLYQREDVESIVQILSKLRHDKLWGQKVDDHLKAKAQEFRQDWRQRAVEIVSSS